MDGLITKALGRKIGETRVTPSTVKIVMIFTIFLLFSNFATNYINLMLNRGEQIRLLNELLVKDLADLHIFANNQFELFKFNPNLNAALTNIEQAAELNHRGERALTLGIAADGALLFQAGRFDTRLEFDDTDALRRMFDDLENGVEEGVINFRFEGFDYFGLYKYNRNWEAMQIRAEEIDEFYQDSRVIFRQVGVMIVVLSLIFVVAGVLVLRFILRFVRVITENIMRMQAGQQLHMMDLNGASNDDITYLGIAFNSLSSTIDKLMTIFKKFVARDVAAKAYREREIRLEGSKRDLTILFTDIKQFTFMTETLGNDIIKLLNLHYDRAIHCIHDLDGDIGSIIGDALLAIFGTISESEANKSLSAIRAAYRVHEVAASLREQMHERREQIITRRGSLTPEEQIVYRAVLLEIGVGIDGGQVFYGNIGSDERMVNTVIGDNVNSASRLEGLTRFYKVPVIVSEYVRDDAMNDTGDYEFVELDRVQVKGKTIGKRVFWPVPIEHFDDELTRDVEGYKSALQLYYQGSWAEAAEHFQACGLVTAQLFVNRIRGREAPSDWNGVWTISEK